ncbi:MAG: replication initiation protein [Campylobacterales bacterium]|nr:replication initiation protein [Campylobacterales bacterium]
MSGKTKDKDNKQLSPTSNEVIKNRVFGQPISKLTRHQRVAFTNMIKIAYDALVDNRDEITFTYPTKDFFTMIGITPQRKQAHLFTQVFTDDEGFEEIDEDKYSLEETLKELLKKQILFRKKKEDQKTYEVEGVSLLSYFKLNRETVTFRFDEWIREKVYVTGDAYIMKLPIIATFRSSYTVALFEQLEQRRDFRRWEVTVKALRYIFGVTDDEYPLFSNFRRKIIEVAKKELEEKTNYTIGIDYKKEGRKIAKVIFTWHINKTSLMEFQAFMRSKFVNKPLFTTKSEKDGSLHVIQISEKGMLYNGKDPGYYYPAAKAKELWKWMYEHQEHLLIKDDATSAAEFSEEDYSKYYGSNLILDGEMYENIILITPTKSKLKVKFYSGDQIILDEDEFIGCVLI